MAALETDGPLIALELIADGQQHVDLVGLIDTGSQHTYLDLGIAERMSLTTPTIVRVRGVADTTREGCVCKPFALRMAGRLVSFTNGFAIEMQPSVGYSVLVGRDVLRHAKMVYEGDRCTLSFAR